MRKQSNSTKYPGVKKVKDGLYRIRFRLKDSRTGKYREEDKLIQVATAQQAAEYRTQLYRQSQLDQSEPAAERMRVGDFARLWLKSKAVVLDQSTSEKYANALEMHVLPFLGDFYYNALRSIDVQNWITESLKRQFPCQKEPKKHLQKLIYSIESTEVQTPKFKSYSVHTVHSWFRMFRTMTRDAVAQLDLMRDPTARITFPNRAFDNDENSLSPKELSQFLQVMKVKFPHHYALTATLAFTGLRFCHASALRWEDLNEEESSLTICRKNYQKRVGKVSTKKRAPRIIPIPEELTCILREHWQWLLAAQPELCKEGWLFPSGVGGLRFPSSMSKAWQRCIEELNLNRRFTVHGLRRTFNDLARHAGIDAIVTRSITGHVTERMQEHYSTVRLEEKRKAIQGVAQLIPMFQPTSELTIEKWKN